MGVSADRKARRDRVTRILLNLCASLMVLLVVLYVAERLASSRLGCRVANVCRYYLVLVSLLWNGVEAHNMYRMLVQVFDTGQQSHFVRKAAVVAWGRSRLPMPAFSVRLSVCLSSVRVPEERLLVVADGPARRAALRALYRGDI